VVFLAIAPQPVSRVGPSDSVGEPIPPGGEAWYTPTPEDFRPSYDPDTANRKKQTWDQYWSWVKVFYEGKFLFQGWTSRAQWLLDGVKSRPEQQRLRAKLNAIGTNIAREWAKDSDVSKVNTADLRAWGKVMEKARADDDGRGTEIERALEAIRIESSRKTKRAR
jgi:hypothetical protein